MPPSTPDSDRLEISTAPERLDIPLIHQFLGSTYWANGIPLHILEKCIRNSLCFGAYLDGAQVGFARMVTDYSTFGYLADVFVVPEHRGKGISKRMMEAILAHPELQGFRRILLATRDAHGLYAKFGFKPIPNPEFFMTIHHPNVYVQQ